MALTIRPNTPEEMKLIEDAKKATGNSSASKALMDAAHMVVYQLPALKNELAELQKKISDINRSESELLYMIARKSDLQQELTGIENKIKNAIKTRSGSAAAGSSGSRF